MRRDRVGVFAWMGALLALAVAAGPAGPPLLVDNFEGADIIRNALGNRANVFLRQPSKAMVSRRFEIVGGEKTRVLTLRYDKQNAGGPFGTGGWCGYYTLLKTAEAVSGSGLRPELPGAASKAYLDAGAYRSITLWVRGERGDENFVVGVADRHWDRIGDSVKSLPIGQYLPAGKVTTDWQKAVIPLEEFYVDLSQLASIAIVFDSDLFPMKGASGTVHLDDIRLE